jgi:ribose 5-phosphate isomerase B
MKIAVVTDELYPIHTFVLDWLKSQGHEPILFGALQSNQDESWVHAAAEAAQAIKDEVCTEGIFFCWTGTGISMAANKVPGIRAALCTDAETARGARIWNHANVLALSNRLLSQDVSKEILTAWFEDYDAAKGAKGVAELRDLESSIT